jgi:hypothetical protein
VDEVHVKLTIQIAEASYIPATSELNKDILPNRAASLHPAVQTMGVPVRAMPTCSQMRVDPSNNPQMVVFLIPLRIHEELCSHRVEDARLRQNDNKCCSGTKHVNKQRTVPMALSPAIQVRDSPVSPALTRSHMCYKPSYGPQTTLASLHLRFNEELRRSCHLGVELGQIDKDRCSVRDNVSKQQTVPLALSPHIHVRDSPVSSALTHSHTRYNPSYETAISLNIPHFH